MRGSLVRNHVAAFSQALDQSDKVKFAIFRSYDVRSAKACYRKSHPSVFWLVKYILSHRIDTVYTRRGNKHLLRTARLAAALTGTRFVSYLQPVSRRQAPHS